MQLTRFFLILVLLISIASGVFGQSWDSKKTDGAIVIEWAKEGNEYTFTLKNPIVPDRPYQLLVWSLEPFNIAAPVSVKCPDGWEWSTNGNWKQFELSKSNMKYDVGGPALEPGESLVFSYTVGSSTSVVNSGAPVSDTPLFLSHVGAVSGQKNGKWNSFNTANGNTWYDKPQMLTNTSVPEAPTWMVIIFSFFMFACLRVKRARV